MSLTAYKQPYPYNPAYNKQAFDYLSTAIGNSDFMYRVICTDLITSGSQTYNIKQRPVTGELNFDASIFSKNYIKNYIPNNEYGWKRCTDAIRKIRINVGEYYASTYYAGTNYDYIIWNGVSRTLDWVNYDEDDYVYKNSTNNYKYITSDTYNTLSALYTSNKVTYEDRSHFLYVLSSENNDMEFIRINAFDSGGNLLHYSDIANPYSVGSTYTDKYVCIDVGHKGLTNISSGLVTGTYPIITPSVAYYDVIDGYTNIVPEARQNVSRIYIGCEPRHQVYTLHYLAPGGNFETLHFNKVSELKERADKSTFRQNPNTLTNHVYEYGTNSKWERVLSSTGTENLILNTDWLTVDQVAFHREIVTSPEVYIDYGSVIGLVPVIVKTSEILVNKDWNNKMFGITLEVEPTYRNNYQHG